MTFLDWPDLIKGYGHVKEAGITKAHARRERSLAALTPVSVPRVPEEPVLA